MLSFTTKWVFGFAIRFPEKDKRGSDICELTARFLAHRPLSDKVDFCD